MSYDLNNEKFKLVIAAYQRGEQITRETLSEIVGVTSLNAVKKYEKMFDAWREDQADAEECCGAEEECGTGSCTKETPSEQPPHPSDGPNWDKDLVEGTTTEVNEPVSQDLVFQTLLENKTILLEDVNGIEEKLEVSSSTPRALILKKIVPIIKEVIVGGSTIKVDVRDLRSRDPESEVAGVKVKTLLIAAELA